MYTESYNVTIAKLQRTFGTIYHTNKQKPQKTHNCSKCAHGVYVGDSIFKKKTTTTLSLLGEFV